jgi:hypothetical protein
MSATPVSVEGKAMSVAMACMVSRTGRGGFDFFERLLCE